MKKRFAAALLSAAMLLSLAAGCGPSGDSSSAAPSGGSGDSSAGSETANFNKTGFPIVNEPITLRFAAPLDENYQNGYSDMKMFKEYEEESGIHIEWEEINGEAWADKVQLMITSNTNLPDAFYGGTIPNSVVLKYGQQGMIVELTDLLKEYAPNATKWLEARDDLRKQIVYSDGKIYSLPKVDEALGTRIPSLMIVNQTWLDRVGLEAPTNVDEFYNMLKTFKEKDANGIGVKGDEICLSARQFSSANVVNGSNSIGNFFGFFGVADDNSHINIVDDKVIFVPTTEEYREGLEFFNKLYTEGLFDGETFTQNDNQFWAKSRSEEGIGMTAAFSWLELNNGETEKNNYVIIDAFEDQVVAKPGLVTGVTANCFTIMSNNKYPEATIRWVDTFLDAGERAVSARFGEENISWKWQNDEKTAWTEMAETPDGEAVNTALIGRYSPVGNSVYWNLGGDGMAALKQNTVQQFIDRGNANNNVYINHAVQTWPSSLSFDEDKMATFTDIDTELRKYTDNMLSTFILQGIDDNSWNAYVEQCKTLGSETLVQMYQERWDEYLAL